MTRMKLLFVFLLAGAAAQGQDLLHSNSHWISFPPANLNFPPGPSFSVSSGSYTFTQKYERDAAEIYVKRDHGEPLLIFWNQGYAELLIGHHGEHCLVNYYAATKDFEVFGTNLATGTNGRIDQQALRMFSADSGADPSLLIVAAGEALSADDRQALLSVNLIYISVGTKEEAKRAGKTFKKWWYAVNSSTGQVLHEFRAASVPSEWQREYRQTGAHRLHP
jgi:hypothetical protein